MLSTTIKKEAWKTIGIFLAFLIGFSALAYYAILKLNPTSIYIGALMISPAIAAFCTLAIKKKSLLTLPWKLKDLRYLKRGYALPLIYISVAYVFIWTLGFGELIQTTRVERWAKELGLTEVNQTFVVVLMIVLLLTVGVIKNLGSTLGEEIGWRGFLIFELRKLMSFKLVAIVSGVIWAIWHFPILFLMYGNSDYLLLHILSFTVMITGISVILAYYTFQSNSLWPAAVFHSIHNIYIQKICTPLTISNETTTIWIDEYGLMVPIVTTLFALYYWRRAIKENL